MRGLVLALVLPALVSAAGCLSHDGPAAWIPSLSPGSGSERSDARGLPLPTKDEVVLVDGRPISIAGFMAIRSQMARPTTESVFWVGVASLVLQNESRARGAEIPLDQALLVARFALHDVSGPGPESAMRQAFPGRAMLPTPEEARQEIDRLVSRAVVQRNPQVLAEMR